MLLAALAGLLLFLPEPFPAQTMPPPRKIQVSDGIYLFITAPYSDAGLDGNSIAVLSPDGVLVFDSNGTPAAASAVLAEIKAMTSAPVRYLVNSHWHWDHWYGAEVYRRAFPGIQIITHEKSRQMMMGPERVFNKPGLDEQLPQHISQVEQQVTALSASKPGSPTDSLTIYLGDREIRVLHYDRAVTPGDAFLYLPKVKALMIRLTHDDPTLNRQFGIYLVDWFMHRVYDELDGRLSDEIMVPKH